MLCNQKLQSALYSLLICGSIDWGYARDGLCQGGECQIL